MRRDSARKGRRQQPPRGLLIAAAILAMMVNQGTPFRLRAIAIDASNHKQRHSSQRPQDCGVLFMASEAPDTSEAGSKGLQRHGLVDRQSLLGGLLSLATLAALPMPTRALNSDEYEVAFNSSDKIGLSLEDFGERGKFRVYVKRVLAGSQAEAANVEPPALIVSVNGNNVEGLPKQYVLKMFKQAEADGKPLVVVFRDPNRFIKTLQQKPRPGREGGLQQGGEVTTQLAPETKSREAQVLKVKKLSQPEICNYGAQYGDLLEIAYTTSLEDGRVLDYSAANTPGRGGDQTLYFVLGQQPAGQFPPGWDLAMTGMCVGERRQIKVPPVLAYGPKGMKRRGIPPDAIIVYDVGLVGINGNNLPR